MNDYNHTILCVDDEENILSSLKRLLRKEGYRLLTAPSGAEGLKLLEENSVHLVISDQRMPRMDGTQFLAKVKEGYPDAIRIILTGYTDVDSITESINKGHVYKFLLKPWNDQSLKLEIKQALEQYDLIQTNKTLHEKVLEQNEELKTMNENLEALVSERTKQLEIQNRTLEFSRAILQDLPLPIIGVSSDGMIAVINQEAQAQPFNGHAIEVGGEFAEYFPTDVQQNVAVALETNKTQSLEEYRLSDGVYNIDVSPLSGRFCGRGVIMTLRLLHK
ncbi:MAG: response regulator [Deltaproteobacteria bacterium]|nr:response regulator [Deltaproteobacteria bacterium]